MNGHYLRKWRVSRKLTTSQVAKALGYRRRQIERIENGNKPLRRCIVLALKALDAKLAMLDPLEEELHARTYTSS